MKPPPLAVSVGGINREGTVFLKFNQPIYVPPQYSERLLCEINSPKNRMFDIEMSINSEECFGYNTEIVEWTENEVQLRLVFDDPLKVSRGDSNDQMQIRLIDASMFVSKLTGESLDAETASAGVKVSVPRQMPEGIVEEEIQK